MRKKITWINAVILMILTAVTTYCIVYTVAWNQLNSFLEDSGQTNDALAKFAEAEAYVKRYYVGEINEQAMMDQAMKGYISAIGDRWSAYLTAEEFSHLEDSMNNQYTGVGINVVYDAEKAALIVAQVYEGSSAGEAGIVPGDLIVGIDGLWISDIGYDTAVDKIKGREGTSVALRIVRPDTGREEEITLKRKLTMKDAVGTRVLDNQIGYVRIENFDVNVDRDFREKVAELIEAGVVGLVFDVRYNNGGNAAIMTNMLDMLLPEGMIFSLQDKNGDVAKEYTSDADEIDLPMAVLINRYSYSAAEFFAAALQEYDKAVIVGEKTIGKGYAQSTIPLSDGSGLYLSIYTYYTPKGRNLAGIGIEPDIQSTLPDEKARRFSLLEPEEDTQLQRAVRAVINALEANAESDPANGQPDSVA